MTIPLTDQQLAEIQTLDLLALMDDRAAGIVSGHLAVLLAEVHHLRAQRRYLIAQLAKKDTASGAGNKALREFLAAEPVTEDLAAADNPTPLRWGLDDVLHGDDDTTIVLLSGPDGALYWLELDPERARVLRDNLAGLHGDGESHVVADDSNDPEFAGTRPCGHNDYHDPHAWHDRPNIWCPGISDADDDAAVTETGE